MNTTYALALVRPTYSILRNEVCRCGMVWQAHVKTAFRRLQYSYLSSGSDSRHPFVNGGFIPMKIIMPPLKSG